MTVITIPIERIQRGVYGNECGQIAEPSREDVVQAVNQQRLDGRNFQTDAEDIAKEWTTHHPKECAAVAKQYHAQRIAFFWVNGWEREFLPTVCKHNILEDGGHRFLAAKFKGEVTIDCRIVACNKCRA